LRRWRAARSLGDLGELTALWLEGKIAAQPGSPLGRVPADETAPLVPALAALCRAGYMTAVSQPALPRDAGGWEQRAAVHGFAGPATALRVADAALAAGLEVIVNPPGRRPGRDDTLIVNRRRDATVSGFGPLPARVVRSPVTGWGLCHPGAVAELCSAWQVTVADPVWDRPWLLWRSLEAALAPREAEPG
jgi:hypothetical protein